MSNYDKLMEKFVSYLKKNIKKNKITLPNTIYNFLEKETKKKIKKINFSKEKNEQLILIQNFNLFNQYFWENEHIKSLKYNLVPPFSMEIKKESNEYVAFLKGSKLEIRKCLILCYYNPNNKTFVNTAYIRELSILKKNYSKLKVLTNSTFSNVGPQEADDLAVFYRTLFYIEKKNTIFRKYLKSYGLDLKNYNLVKFFIEKKSKPYITFYFLTDLGFNEPKLDKTMKNSIDYITKTIELVTNNDKKGGSKKKSHKINYKLFNKNLLKK